MNDDDLKELFQQQPPLEANELSKARHKKLALDAFRDQQREKNSAVDQGITTSSRPTHTYTPVRDRKMLSISNRTWLSAIAASVIVAVGFVAVAPQMTSLKQPATKQEGQLSGKSLSPSNVAIAPESKVDAVTPARENEAVIAESLADRQLEQPVSPSAELDGFSEPMKRAAPRAETQGLESRVMARQQSMAKEAGDKVTAMPSRISPDLNPPPLGNSDHDRFQQSRENTVKQVAEVPVSTFSIDVDTASYSYVRRQLNQGRLPAQDAVRIEEMINYFDYDYPLPQSRELPFATHVNVMPSPWAKGNKLIQIGIKGFELQEQPDSNLVFLLDVSGSMNSPDKLPLVKQSMGLLLDSLKPTDHVAIVVYAGAAGTVLAPTKVANKQAILNALNLLQAGGATAGGQGLALAYSLAEANFNPRAVNRVILATDGDFNLGITQDQRLEDFVERKRHSGIYLSVLGFGQGNYQDALMQTLAQNGNGTAAYIDTLGEAQKVLVHQATSALFPIANDVKIQLEFNPATVAEYRLIGYETRALNREDFNNDKVDAGDIGAGHSVTAIYEITPIDSGKKSVDDLRYASPNTAVKSTSDEYAFLKLRYKLPGDSQSQLISTPITKSSQAQPRVQKEFLFATAVTGFAQLLRNSNYAGTVSYDQIIGLAQANKGEDLYGYRTEFIQLVRKAKIAH